MASDSPVPALSPLSPRRWFDSSIPVDRRSYVASGFLLMALKYVIEAVLIGVATQKLWLPHLFLVPIASMRADWIGGDAVPLLVALGLLSLPFLYVGLSMSVRRASDAGASPFLGTLFVVPFLNYALILYLSLVPSSPAPQVEARSRESSANVLTATIGAVVGATVFGLVCTVIAQFESLGKLGGALFFVTPIAMGVFAGYLPNARRDLGAWRTIVLAASTAFTTATALLLFGIEGMICIVMAFPIGLVAIVVGALIGRQLALASARPSGLAFALGIPLLAAFPPLAPTTETHHVYTTIEVDAPPEVVFEQVVAFPPIEGPRPWYFRTGIAVPLRARIEGRGVGAVRHCEFTTGSFVEPITAWEPGRRLAFDVTSSPPPMEEWSPYRIHPRHLDSTMRSRRGEFLLSPLPGGRTRLVGHTEYELGLAPDVYFAPMSDALLHLIHERVLEHVAAGAERIAHGGG